jgi:Uma2 family endonuclease
MPVMVLDDALAQQILANRESSAGERQREEVWDGVTYIMPEADNSHDKIASFFHGVFWTVFGMSDKHALHFRVNVSDRAEDWKSNYRVPDLSLYLAGTQAKDAGTHWVGGPDFALEVVSRGDRSRDKLDFYASVGTREVLILDRDPWRIELYQLADGKLQLRGTATPGASALKSSVAPFTFELVRSQPRPNVKIVSTETGQEWVG